MNPIVVGQYEAIRFVNETETLRLRVLYYDLLMSVKVKFEGETLHEAALRCIKEHENFPIVEPSECRCDP